MIFFDRAPNLLLKIKTAVDANESRDLESSAHALKGSCGNLGANHMAELCRQLEENGRNEVAKIIFDWSENKFISNTH